MSVHQMQTELAQLALRVASLERALATSRAAIAATKLQVSRLSVRS